MRLVFIRHCEPDYEKDSLTKKGFREAEILAQRVGNWKVDRFFCSPLGRAVETSKPSLAACGKEATTLGWLCEFYYPIVDPSTGKKHCPWDFMPEWFTKQEEFYDKDECYTLPVFAENKELKPAYDEIADGIDGILATYGYTRDGLLYHADPVMTKNDDSKTIVFFCHLGVSLEIIGHLLGIAPPMLQQCFYLAPSSVTVLNAEKRQNNNAFFRVQVMGDTSHLRMACEPVSTMGAFSEVMSG